MDRKIFTTPTTQETVGAMVGGWDRAGDKVLAALELMREAITKASQPAMPDLVVDDLELLQELAALHDRFGHRAALWRSMVRLRVVDDQFSEMQEAFRALQGMGTARYSGEVESIATSASRPSGPMCPIPVGMGPQPYGSPVDGSQAPGSQRMGPPSR